MSPTLSVGDITVETASENITSGGPQVDASVRKRDSFVDAKFYDAKSTNLPVYGKRVGDADFIEGPMEAEPQVGWSLKSSCAVVCCAVLCFAVPFCAVLGVSALCCAVQCCEVCPHRTLSCSVECSFLCLLCCHLLAFHVHILGWVRSAKICQTLVELCLERCCGNAVLFCMCCLV